MKSILILFLLIISSIAGIPEPPKIDYVKILPSQPNMNNSSVIFYDDFEVNRDLTQKYHEYNDNDKKFIISKEESFGGSQYSLEQMYVQGQVNAGWIWYFFGDNPLRNEGKKYKEIYVRWYHKFEENFQSMPPKTARITSITRNDWTVAWMVHWWQAPDYYVVADVASNIEADGNSPVEQGYNNFTRWLPVAKANSFTYSNDQNLGRWICHEIHLELNTPGQSDGIYQYWADNELIINVQGRNLSGYWDQTTINAVQWDCYWNQGSPKEQSRFYDNLMISTERIGLAYTSLNPVVVTDVPSGNAA